MLGASELEEKSLNEGSSLEPKVIKPSLTLRAHIPPKNIYVTLIIC